MQFVFVFLEYCEFFIDEISSSWFHVSCDFRNRESRDCWRLIWRIIACIDICRVRWIIFIFAFFIFAFNSFSHSHLFAHLHLFISSIAVFKSLLINTLITWNVSWISRTLLMIFRMRSLNAMKMLSARFCDRIQCDRIQCDRIQCSMIFELTIWRIWNACNWHCLQYSFRSLRLHWLTLDSSDTQFFSTNSFHAILLKQFLRSNSFSSRNCLLTLVYTQFL